MYVSNGLVRRWPLLLATLAVLLAACSGPRPPREEPREEPEEEPLPDVRHSDYEEFDPSPYEETLPEAETEIEHEVPERLMEGRSTTGATSAQGFRIQVYSTLDKSAADRLEEEARAWLQASGEGVAARNAVYTIYRPPYYRVRIGNFRTRAEADRARRQVAGRFPDAFIVPDRVTISR